MVAQYILILIPDIIIYIVYKMAKRNAAKELTHDNWDQEEESEEAGVFKQVNGTGSRDEQ